MNLNSSDRKKLLALPFYMSKRSQLPEPKIGQLEFKIFKELTGSSWFDDADVEVDKEHKITEFDYENFFDANLLKRNKALTETEDFKKVIKILNLFSHTKYEKLQEDKENFKQIMPLLRGLNESEVEILLHKL